MGENNEAEKKQQEQEQIVELGSTSSKTSKGNIYTLTIIGQVEGHQIAPENVKTTKYEHILPLLAGIEKLNDLYDWLKEKGYDEKILNRLFYQNASDFFKKINP